VSRLLSTLALIWRLARPYFVSEDRWAGRILLGAVIALAGGPGQSALPFMDQFAQILGPIVATRDLIVFDQRGTGLSHPLSCAALKPTRASGERVSP